jgi:hypothetical protein
MSIAIGNTMIAAAAGAVIALYVNASHGQGGPALPNPLPANPALPNPLPANPALPNPLPANPAEPNPLPRAPGFTPGTPPIERQFYPGTFSSPYVRHFVYYCPYYAQYYPYASVCPGGWRAVPTR